MGSHLKRDWQRHSPRHSWQRDDAGHWCRHRIAAALQLLSVAASGIGAGVGEAVSTGLQGTQFARQADSPGSRRQQGFAGLATAASKGGRVAVQQAAADAFGNAQNLKNMGF
jgi:hypothetical protein